MESKEVIIISEAIKDSWKPKKKRYIIHGIEVDSGDYHNASKFEVIVYPEGGWTTASPRAWYEEIDKLVSDHLENSEFYKNFKDD